jgi:uncharacterized membrane protein YhiD involved in acid resistance
MNWTLDFKETALADLQLLPLLINLILVLIMGQSISWHYMKFAQVLSNKKKMARIFVFMAATTMMVISVVKVSLALSLGLVGALSIIRFRTPVKEPEELAYLFLSIAVGIGMGADQRIATVIMFVVILAYLSFYNKRRGGAVGSYLLFNIQTTLGRDTGSAMSPATALEGILSLARKLSARISLRRVDSQDDDFNVTLMVDIKDDQKLGGFIEDVQELLPGAAVSVVEGEGLE